MLAVVVASLDLAGGLLRTEMQVPRPVPLDTPALNEIRLGFVRQTAADGTNSVVVRMVRRDLQAS